MLDKSAISALKHIVGRQLLLDASDVYAYSYDNSRLQSIPDAVAFAHSHDETAAIVRVCYEHSIPVVARGRGTGTTGATVPLRHGLVLSFERMKNIINIDPDNRYLVAEPGVTNGEVQRAAAEHGFFWAPDPSSADYCAIGGNIGCNSAGPRAVKYGSTRENTLGLRAVIGTGESIKTGVYTTKGVVGYDLTRLIIGSEGTLALVTQATLKLLPIPERVESMRFLYTDLESAAAAVSSIMRQPVTPCALEFIDKHCINLIREHSPEIHIPPTAQAMLLVEVDGPRDCLEQAMGVIVKAATNGGLLETRMTHNDAERKELWKARKALSPALRKIAPRKINEDVVVPVATLATFIRQLDTLSQDTGIKIVNFGHAGNGNLHVNLLIDPNDAKQMAQADFCLNSLFAIVLSLNGTLSGEHGVGVEKREHVAKELDPVALGLMRKIKQQFDPKNILNPDKLFPLVTGEVRI